MPEGVVKLADPLYDQTLCIGLYAYVTDRTDFWGPETDMSC